MEKIDQTAPSKSFPLSSFVKRVLSNGISQFSQDIFGHRQFLTLFAFGNFKSIHLFIAESSYVGIGGGTVVTTCKMNGKSYQLGAQWVEDCVTYVCAGAAGPVSIGISKPRDIVSEAMFY